MSGIKKVEEFLRQRTIGDHVISALKALSSLNPITGAVTSLVSDYIPNQRVIKLEQFANSVAHELEKFKKEVNVEFITTNEFAFIFEQCFKGAIENYQQEKIDAFKSIIVNSLRGNNLSPNERELYLNLVDRLSVVHIRVLYFLAQPEDYVDVRGIPQGNIEGSFSQIFRRVMPDIPTELIMLTVHELYNLGFTNTDKSIFGTMTSTSGLDLLSGRVTKNGRDFISFITL